MPTNRSRRSRQNNGISTEVIEMFREWKELDERHGTGRSREGILLTDQEQSEYRELSEKIDSSFSLKPWEAGPTYSMWGDKEHPSPVNLCDWDQWGHWKTAVDIRMKLEAAIENLDGENT